MTNGHLPSQSILRFCRIALAGNIHCTRWITTQCLAFSSLADADANKIIDQADLLIEDRTVRLEFPESRKPDNFGRLLGKVYVGDVDVGERMIDNGHAVKYVPREG